MKARTIVKRDSTEKIGINIYRSTSYIVRMISLGNVLVQAALQHALGELNAAWKLCMEDGAVKQSRDVPQPIQLHLRMVVTLTALAAQLPPSRMPNATTLYRLVLDRLLSNQVPPPWLPSVLHQYSLCDQSGPLRLSQRRTLCCEQCWLVHIVYTAQSQLLHASC